MLNLIENVVAPAVVTSADLVTLVKAPTANEWTDYGMTIAGYLIAGFGLGGKGIQGFFAGLATGSLPLTARHIYERVKGGTAARVAGGQRLALSPISIKMPITRTYQPEFETVGPRAF